MNKKKFAQTGNPNATRYNDVFICNGGREYRFLWANEKEAFFAVNSRGRQLKNAVYAPITNGKFDLGVASKMDATAKFMEQYGRNYGYIPSGK